MPGSFPIGNGGGCGNGGCSGGCWAIPGLEVDFLIGYRGVRYRDKITTDEATRNLDPNNPQAFATGRLQLVAAATDQDDGTGPKGSDSGVGKDLFRFEVAEVNPDGSLGPSQIRSQSRSRRSGVPVTAR